MRRKCQLDSMIVAATSWRNVSAYFAKFTFKGKKALYLTEDKFTFLAFKKLANKNFNSLFLYLTRLYKDFLIKAIVCSAKFQQIFAKIHSSIFPFFSCKTDFPKSI